MGVQTFCRGCCRRNSIHSSSHVHLRETPPKQRCAHSSASFWVIVTSQKFILKSILIPLMTAPRARTSSSSSPYSFDLSQGFRVPCFFMHTYISFYLQFSCLDCVGLRIVMTHTGEINTIIVKLYQVSASSHGAGEHGKIVLVSFSLFS